MKCCPCCGPKTKYSILLLCGLILIALPLAFHDYINDQIQKKIDDNVKIAPNSQIYDEWHKPTIPIYLQIYAFSIVNHLEFQGGEAPYVVEKGPYSYRESREKFNITWRDDNVNYNQVTHYVFDPSTSCPDCDPMKDNITSINIPYVTLLQKVSEYVKSTLLDEVLDFFLKHNFHEDLVETRTVHETIWGYNETLFDDYDDFRKEAIKKYPFLNKILPKAFPRKFALQMNPNYDGNTTVYTGQSNIDRVGCYQRWKENFGKLDIWNSRYANMLNGTDGSVYKPSISKDDVLYIFITQLCRSLDVEYLDEVTVQGIDGYRFHPPTYLFQSGDINPDNKGFCNPDCLPTGLLSINACVPFNASIVVSQPHFLNGNKSLQKMVLGLSPDEEKHDTFLSLEPRTGILLQASKRIQFNIHVVPMKGISDLENVKEAQVPIMWINEHVAIDLDNANKVKKNVLNKLEIIKWLEIGLLILGGLMVLCAIILFIRLCCRKSDETRLKLTAEHQQDYGSNGTTGRLNPSIINASD